MAAARFCLRLAVAVSAAFLLVTLLLWHSPGRDLDDQPFASSQPARHTPAWNSHSEFALSYLRQLSAGDAGRSTLFDVPVVELVAERASLSGSLLWRAFTAAWILSLVLSALSFRFPRISELSLAAGSATLCLPAAFLVLVLVLSGLPAWSGLALCIFPKIHAYCDALLGTAARRRHVLAFAAAGAGHLRLLRHAILPGLGPQLLGLAAVSVPLALGALIPVEVIAAEPGLGQLAWKAVAGRDLPLLTAITLLFAAFTSAASLLAESFLQEPAR